MLGERLSDNLGAGRKNGGDNESCRHDQAKVRNGKQGRDVHDGEVEVKIKNGVGKVDNPRHSDFLAIRSALLHSHLADLKEITHDFLYENYRTEKLSKSVEGGVSGQDSSINPEDLANQSVLLKEEQLRREEEKLREIEVKVQREINEKRQELLARESQLREIEARMQREQSGVDDMNGHGLQDA